MSSLASIGNYNGDDLNNSWSNTTTLYTQVISLFNTIYYLLLIPIALVGNVLTLMVAIYIVRYQRTRRSIPDICLGTLAAVDLFSVMFVHSVTLGALIRGWTTYPPRLCVYQSFAASVYLKMEFLVQVIISLDRHFAVARPLRYHKLSSVRSMRLVLVLSLVFSIVMTVLHTAFSLDNITFLETWMFCILKPRFESVVEKVVCVVVGGVFVAGFIAFVVCNVTLVRLLCQYHARRANSLLREISEAVHAMAKENSPPADPASQAHAGVPRVIQIRSTGAKNNPAEPQKEMSAHHAAQEASHGSNVAQPESIVVEVKASHNIEAQSRSVRQTHLNKQSTSHRSCGGNGGGEVDVKSPDTKSILPTEPDRDGSKAVSLEHTCVEGPRAVTCAQSACAAGTDDNATHHVTSSRDASAAIVPRIMVLFVGSAESSPRTGHDVLGEVQKIDLPQNSLLKGGDDIQLCHEHVTTRETLRQMEQSDSHTTAHPGCFRNVPMKKSVSFVLPKQDKKYSFSRSHSADNLPSAALNVIQRSVLSDTSSTSVCTLVSFCKIPVENTEMATNSHKIGPDSITNKLELNIPLSKSKLSVSQSLPLPRTPSSASIHTQKQAIRPKHLLRDASQVLQSESRINHSHLNHLQQNLQKFLRKMQKRASRHKRELYLARLVLLCATLFIITWIPYIVVVALGVAKVSVGHLVEDIALKLVFLNAVLNPVFYGLCRKNYRRGYKYLMQLGFHFLCCGFVDRPGEEQVFFESKGKRVKRHLQVAEVNMRRKKSAHALQILQQTLNLRPQTPQGDKVFSPSKGLQDLFERYMQETDSDSDTSSSIDYDALLFDEEEDLYQNLRKVWSMCMNAEGSRTSVAASDSCEVDAERGEDDMDIELDVDYDALVADDVDYSTGGLYVGKETSENRSEAGHHGTVPHNALHHLSMSAPNFKTAEKGSL